MDCARPGDLVLFVGRDYKRFIVRLKPGARIETHRGVIHHDDVIGESLGREFVSHLGQPLLALQPSIYDLIRDIRRSSQIIFPQDAAYSIMKMNIHPGSRVIEAGSGSGGLTLALAYYVMPTGRVYSYDMREDMLNLARNNLEKVDLADFVDFKLRDIEQGFDETAVDALFLDVRNPASYLEQAWTALKGGGFFGALLPTSNQVIVLLSRLSQHGFGHVEVEELLVRPYKAVPGRFRPMDRMVAHTGYLVFARKIDTQLLSGSEEETEVDDLPELEDFE